MVKLYWDWTGMAPDVALTGVPDPSEGEKLLVEFRALCHRHYVAWSEANSGLFARREQLPAIMPQGMVGTIGFISRPADFAPPPLSHSIPQMGMDQYRAAFEPDGDFVQYQSRALIVFIYQTWEDVFRPQIAKLYGVGTDRVRCHLMGDLRHVRNDIIHDQGRISINRELPFLSQCWKIKGDQWKFLGEDMRHLMDQISSLQVFVATGENR